MMRVFGLPLHTVVITLLLVSSVNALDEDEIAITFGNGLSRSITSLRISPDGGETWSRNFAVHPTGSPRQIDVNCWTPYYTIPAVTYRIEVITNDDMVYYVDRFNFSTCSGQMAQLGILPDLLGITESKGIPECILQEMDQSVSMSQSNGIITVSGFEFFASPSDQDMNFSEATTWARNLDIDGRDDWSIPTSSSYLTEMLYFEGYLYHGISTTGEKFWINSNPPPVENPAPWGNTQKTAISVEGARVYYPEMTTGRGMRAIAMRRI
jgi:hypothetical protein